MRRVQPRRPFRLVTMPWLARLYRFAFEKRYSLAGRLAKTCAHVAYRGAYRLGADGVGQFSLQTSTGERLISWHARNTQFHALYMPAYAAGYEPETSALLDVLVEDNHVFFDVGSNWGYYALFLASREGFGGQVHAFEPWPPTFGDLKRCVEESGLQERITCHALALSNQSDMSSMSIRDNLHSGIAQLGSSSEGGNSVQTAALDELELPGPNVMKIDVEGHEHQMLAGAQRVLAEQRPAIVLESWRQFANPEVTLKPLQLLRDAGYAFFQPVWIVAWQAETYATADLAEGIKPRLGLMPFRLEERFLFQEQINVLAYPAERLDQLNATFCEPD